MRIDRFAPAFRADAVIAPGPPGAGERPGPANAYIERRAETGRLRRVLRSARLVTVTGVGGVGKSRLARRVADDLQRAFPGGVAYVDLSDVDLTTPDRLVAVAAAIGGQVGIAGQRGRGELAELIDHFRDRAALLLLDNCEFVGAEVATLTLELLRAAAPLKVLATSRQALGCAGESVLTIGPLAAPEAIPTGDAGVGSPAEFDAVRLFLARAREAVAGFDPEPADLGRIGAICRELDGLPQAIELAAAELSDLSPAEILAGLHAFRSPGPGRHPAPAGGPPGAAHHVLLDSIEWTYGRCSPAEQRLWRRISVLAGSWTLDAAEAVAAGPDLAAADVLDRLHALVEKSVVVREPDPPALLGGPVLAPARFHLVGSVQRFGLARLADSDELLRTRRLHLDWCRDLLAGGEATWLGPNQARWLHRARRDLPNLRAALEFALAAAADPDPAPEDGSAALELTVVGWRVFWWAQGRVDELADWLDRVLPTLRGSEPLGNRARAVRAMLAAIQQRPDGVLPVVAAARVAARSAGDPTTVELTWMVEGHLAMRTVGAGAAVPLFERGLREGAAGGDENQALLARMMLVVALYGIDDQPRARLMEEEVRRLAERHGERFELSYFLHGLGVAAWRQGQPAQCRDRIVAAVAIHRELGDVLGVALGLVRLAAVASAEQEFDAAARLFGAAQTVWLAAGATESSYPSSVRLRDDGIAATRAGLGGRRFQRGFAEGRGLSVAAATALALGEPAPVAEDEAGQTGPRLTPREREIAGLVARGLTNREVAAELLIAQRTAEGHVERILAKLDLSSRTQIVAWVHAQRAK